MTKVINFYGGPSAGKSTLAAQLFGEMKARRMNVEMAPEYAKDLVWKKSGCIDDQLYVFAKQHHKIYTLLDQVDFVISDSPLLLSLHYIHHGFRKHPEMERVSRDFQNLVVSINALYDNVNLFVDRKNREFIQAGRLQNETEAKEIDNSVRNLLDAYQVKYEVVSSFEEVQMYLLD